MGEWKLDLRNMHCLNLYWINSIKYRSTEYTLNLLQIKWSDWTYPVKNEASCDWSVSTLLRCSLTKHAGVTTGRAAVEKARAIPSPSFNLIPKDTFGTEALSAPSSGIRITASVSCTMRWKPNARTFPAVIGTLRTQGISMNWEKTRWDNKKLKLLSSLVICMQSL